MRTGLVILTLGFWLGAAGTGLAQTKPIQQAVQKDLKKKAEEERGKEAALEQLLAEALRNNPDIRVAEFKVRTAEAEANRLRLRVVAEVTALSAEIQAARAAVEEAQHRAERVKQLHDRRSISQEEYQAALLVLEKYRAELAIKQAQLPMLLGRYPGGGSPAAQLDELLRKKFESAPGETLSDETFLRRITLDLFGRLPTVAEMQQFLKLPQKERRTLWLEQLRQSAQTAASAAAGTPPGLPPQLGLQLGQAPGISQLDPQLVGKLLKALNAQERMEVTSASRKEILEYVREKMLPGINLHVRTSALKSKADEPLDIRLKEPLPVGAILQYLEDELGIVFILRDYGLVAAAAEGLPPGAIRVVELWRQDRAAAPASPPREAK